MGKEIRRHDCKKRRPVNCGHDSISHGRRHSVSAKDLGTEPIEEFQKWYEKALSIEGHDASAMTLATVTPDGKPTARMVLFKGLQNGNFLFYTNYTSPKAVSLENTPFAALVFYWHPLYQQVRVTGKVQKTTRQDSEAYFHSRARESQIAAAASEQSSVVSGRDKLLEKYLQIEKDSAGQEITCPPHWGGYRVIPHTIEFWMGHKNRLHERVLYTRVNGHWLMSFLNP